jgi:heme/copper-type cytochrome/quinol oxidase subunit 2
MLWQVWAPLGATLALLLAMIGFTILSATHGSSTVDKGASASLIFMIILWMIAGLIQLALLGLCVYLVARLRRATPNAMRQVNEQVNRVANGIQNSSNQAARPVVQMRSWWSGFKTAAGHVTKHTTVKK